MYALRCVAGAAASALLVTRAGAIDEEERGSWRQIRPELIYAKGEEVCEGAQCSACASFQEVTLKHCEKACAQSDPTCAKLGESWCNNLEAGEAAAKVQDQIEGLADYPSTGIRAVKYWPEPVGYRDAFANQTDKDPYTKAYASLHSRDLPMIKYELGADAVLLGAWSAEGQSHAGFLREAERNSLKVIPSFDIGWYWEDGNWNSREVRDALRTDFRAFLENTAVRSRGVEPHTPPSVLMWNIVGLPGIELLFPRQCLQSARENIGNLRDCFNSNAGDLDAAATMREFQEILEIVRTEQAAFFCTQGPAEPSACSREASIADAFAFDRPLALTVELGADFSLAFEDNLNYLKAFTFWMERVLGCAMVAESQVQVPLSFAETLDKCRFRGRGFFDAWVFKVVAATDEKAAGRMKKMLGAFDKARQVERGSGSDDAADQDQGGARRLTSPNPATGSEAQPNAKLKDVAGVMKPVVFEYGFSAMTPLGVMNATEQHRLLRSVWKEIEDPSGAEICVQGAAVDEWLDVWSADQEYSACRDRPSSQFSHSPCGPSTDGGAVAVGFTGIMGNFDALFMHCIDFRVEPNIADCEAEHMFRFKCMETEESDAYTRPSLCQVVWLRPGLPATIYVAVMLLVVALFSMSCCCGGCCRRCCLRPPELSQSYNGDRNLALANQSAASKRVLDDISAAPYGKLLAGLVAEALQDESLEVPVRYEHLVGYSGWGLKKVAGTFSYHRLQYDGQGRGETVQWWESELVFVKWLQEQSDRTMAVHGFTEEDLRRPDLIGNKTITRRQLLEMLDAAGKFSSTESTIGTGEAELDCLGTALRFRFKLRYRACPVLLSSVVDDGPRLKDYDDVSPWLRDIATHTQGYLAVLASSHLQVQGDRLRRQLEHEREALLADDERRGISQDAAEDLAAGGGAHLRAATRPRIPTSCEDAARKKACYNIWRRTCEGAHIWQQLHDLEHSVDYVEDNFRRYFAEALLMRLLESVGEHLIHAPEWIARVYQKALAELTEEPGTADGPCFNFEVDYADLSEPLREFCGNSNVFATKQGINFDDMNDHGLSTSEAPQPLGLEKTYNEPIGGRVLFNTIVNYEWPLTMVVWLFTLSLFLRDSETFCDFGGRVGTKCGDSFSAFLVLLVDLSWLAFVNFCALWVDTPITPHSVRNPFCRLPRLTSLIALVVLVPLAVVLLWVESGLDAPDPAGGEGWIEATVPTTMTREQIRADAALTLAPFAYLVLRLGFGLLPTRDLRLRLKNAEKKGHHKRICAFWIVFGLMCFLMYYGVLTEMARSLTPSNLCQLGDNDKDFCNERHVRLGFIDDFPMKDPQCVACMTSVVCAWTLAVLGSLLVPYFVFNCCVSFMGSSLGVARGLVEMNISSLDFSVQPLSSDFDRQRKAEANWASHGTVLCAIYGKNWRDVWAVMVDGLFDDCLINGPVRDKLLGAAGAGGNVDLVDSGPLRMLPQAMQRIGFLFASHREILSNNRIKFSPYTDSDRDVHCDALGVTHPGRIPSLTQIIPVYSEDGIMSIKELLDKNQQSVATTLEFLISQFPEEWKIFAEASRLHPTELYDKLVKSECTKHQQDQVREWASHRAQSVIRTVNGAVHYHKALQLLLNRGEGVGFEDIRRRVQLILAHQTYGKVSFSKAVQAHLKGGVLSFKVKHGLVAGNKLRLSLQAKSDMDLAGAFAFKRAVDKFKAKLAPKAPAADSGNPTLLRRTAAPAAKHRQAIVLSLTVLNVEHEKLAVDKHALQALEAAIKEALIVEAGDLRPDSIVLTVSPVERGSQEALEPSSGTFGSWIHGLTGSRARTPEISVECVITPAATLSAASLEVHLSSSSTLKHTLASAISGAKGIKAVSGGEPHIGEVSAISQVMPSPLGSKFAEFVSGAFYTVERVLDDQTVVLVGAAADCGQVLSERVEASKLDRDLHYMLRKHKGYPFFVAIDFHRGKTHPRLEELIDQHIQSVRGDREAVRFKYASALIKYRYYRVGGKDGEDDEWPVEVVHVLPRARGLLIGSEGNLSQGKSGNQLGALRFAEGHFLQMMDANMGCYSGESFKVPVVLQGFYKKPTQAEDDDHRLNLRARIIGFREHIFTRSHGLVGTIMADSEWTFGTLVQRLLGFLNVRMHYGHPDFMDCFWASNRGSVSKASPHINLSEDIFAGLNVNARNERSLHTDILEWEKGREVQFCAGSGFFWKISSGSVGLMRTRDLRALCGRASIMQSIALYFATVSWYLHNILVDYGTELYVLLFIFLTLASKSLSDLGALGSALAVEWFLTPALSATLPAVIGFGVEYGPLWLLTQYLPTVPASMVYFIFINKSMASSVRSTIWANTAEYVNTGRPHANKSYSMRDAFVQFRASHYVPAVTLLYLVIVYSLANLGGALPMVMIVATAVCWIIAPVLFRPPTATVLGQFSELADYIFRAPLSFSGNMSAGKATCLYEATLEQELKQSHRDPGQQLVVALALSALYASMAVTTVFEQMPAALFAWAITFCVKAIWRLSGMKQAGVVNLTFQLLLPVVLCFAWVFIEHCNFSTLLLSMIVFVHFMHTAKVLCWSLARLVLTKGSPLNYDRVVHELFDFGLGYQLQVYAGIAVLVLQFICEAILCLLDHPRLRLRTWVLLNRHVAHGCVAKMYGDVPAHVAI